MPTPTKTNAGHKRSPAQNKAWGISGLKGACGMARVNMLHVAKSRYSSKGAKLLAEHIESEITTLSILINEESTNG